MNFDDYLKLAATEPELTIDESWSQGRTTFGGLSAALLLQRITALTNRSEILRSLSVHFCGPLNTENTFQLNAASLRQGKSVSHYHGDAYQDEKLVTTLNACFGIKRTSNVNVRYAERISGSPEGGKKFPYIKGITPEFTRHIDYMYSEGDFPFTNSKHDFVHGWMRFIEGEPLTDVHLIALIDSWPPTLLPKLKSFAPCATVTWNVEIITSLSELATPLTGNAWLRYESEIKQAGDGYGHTEARIYTQDGILLALSRQLVAVYDQR